MDAFQDMDLDMCLCYIQVEDMEDFQDFVDFQGNLHLGFYA